MVKGNESRQDQLKPSVMEYTITNPIRDDTVVQMVEINNFTFTFYSVRNKCNLSVGL